jgi:serine/threonine protein kinase
MIHKNTSPNKISFPAGAATVKLSDFGLMKESASEFTKSDTDIKGTIIDPALEVFKDYNVQNEIYAIGFILNFIFTGKQNLISDDTEVNNIIMKCTNHNPALRYENVTELIADVEGLLEPK